MTVKDHIPSLDGLRAIAALIVFWSHAGFRDMIPGGFGVTLFFFLSGYLITTLLCRELEKNGSVSLPKFYARRAIRLFPPLYVTLLLVFLVFWLTDLPTKNTPTLAGVGSQLFYWANYFLIFVGRDEFVPYTSIYWSLSVEEHFYFLFPLFFIWGLKRLGALRFVRVLLVLSAAALIWRCILYFGFGVGNDYSYYATDTRFDSILAGCILAVWGNPYGEAQRRSRLGGVIDANAYLSLAVAFLILIFTFLFRDEAFRATFRYTLQSIALYPIFHLAISRSELSIFRWLEHPLVRKMGEYSYSFYLSHLFFLFAASYLLKGSGIVGVIVAFLLTIVYCYLVARFVDAPVARIRARLRN